MCEELMVRHASPTLAGLKTGSLFSCPFAGERAMQDCVRDCNRRLTAKGLRLLPLRWQGGRALLYLYRPARLAKDLQHPEARALLAAIYHYMDSGEFLPEQELSEEELEMMVRVKKT